jgi:transposase
MAAPYSLDLRRKIIEACERGSATQVDIAQFFGVSISFVEKLLRIYRCSGELEPPRKPPGRHTAIDLASRQQLVAWLQQQPDLTLAELTERLHSHCAIQVSQTAVCRLLRRLGLRRKKRPSMLQNATRLRYYRPVNSTVPPSLLIGSTA